MFFDRKRITSPRPAGSPAPRRPRRMEFTWDSLEGRKVLSHASHHHLHAAAAAVSGTTGSTASTGTTGTTTALSQARQALNAEVQTIQAASSTTVGQLTAIRTAFQTLATDGLSPSSRSALASFENGLVTAFASGTTLAGNATLLSQFEALYTGTPTATQATDLTTAYNALAAAVTSANVTPADITAIDAAQAAVLTAEGSTSTANFPYFSLVTGRQGRFGGGLGGCA